MCRAEQSNVVNNILDTCNIIDYKYMFMKYMVREDTEQLPSDLLCATKYF